MRRGGPTRHVVRFLGKGLGATRVHFFCLGNCLFFCFGLSFYLCLCFYFRLCLGSVDAKGPCTGRGSGAVRRAFALHVRAVVGFVELDVGQERVCNAWVCGRGPQLGLRALFDPESRGCGTGHGFARERPPKPNLAHAALAQVGRKSVGKMPALWREREERRGVGRRALQCAQNVGVIHELLARSVSRACAHITNSPETKMGLERWASYPFCFQTITGRSRRSGRAGRRSGAACAWWRRAGGRGRGAGRAGARRRRSRACRGTRRRRTRGRRRRQGP